MEKSINVIKINDKESAPFLLAASFQGLVHFLGSEYDNGILYWKFSPVDKVKQLLIQQRTKTEPHIPTRDLFEATQTFWKQISSARNGEMYG